MTSKGITRDRTGLILRELFKVLLAFADGLKAQTAIDRVAARLTLTRHEKGEYETGGRRFDKIVQFCTMDAVKAGWMEKNNGVWAVTPEGKAALTRFPDPGDFYREVSRLYRQWRRRRQLASNATFAEAEKMAWKEIDAYLDTLDPYTFQTIISALLGAMGYVVAWVSPAGKDGGMVFLAWHDPDGQCPPSIKVQVKRRKDAIDLTELSAFLAMINEHDEGFFVTTGTFSEEAESMVRDHRHGKVTLVDGRELVQLWIKNHHKLDTETSKLLPLKPIYFIAPEEEEEPVERGEFRHLLGLFHRDAVQP